MNSKGEFDFQSKGQKIEGKICTWSLNRFCERMNIPNVTELFLAITSGISIKAIAEILLCAVEYKHKGKEFPYTVDDAMDWIDDMGGIAKAHAKIEESFSDENEDSGKKKKAAKSH